MAAFSSFPATPSSSSALVRTFTVWLLSNLGGTIVLALDFSLESPADLTIPLLVGFMAGLISLAYVPLAWPLFALAQRICTGWRCQLLAVAGVVTVFGVANYLLLEWLPIGSFGTLLTFSRPYLGAALLSVAWLYRQQSAMKSTTAKLSRPAPLLNSWCIRPARRRPVLAKY